MQNNSPVDNFWAEMHLDGAQVDQLLCKPGEAKIFEGFKEGGKISEFLFALPRFQRATDGDEVIAKDDASGKSRLSQLGSLVKSPGFGPRDVVHPSQWHAIGGGDEHPFFRVGGETPPIAGELVSGSVEP